jgi:hypothetical protein
MNLKKGVNFIPISFFMINNKVKILFLPPKIF